MKRSFPKLHLSKTPLIFVLAQVRVAPIAKIADFLPSIQENLRHQGFPNLVKRELELEEVVPNPDGVSQVRKTQRVQWELIDTARTTSVLIDDGGLVLQTTAYDSGEQFLERLGLALTAYAEHARPTELQRIGLRYVDLIKPIAGLQLDELVSPAIRAPAQPLPGEPLTHHWQSLRKTGEHTRFLVRYREAEEGPAFPQDIGFFIGLKPSANPVQVDPFGLLDTDHFDVHPTPFAVGNISTRIAALHEVLITAFHDHLVTPAALEAWK